MGLGEKRVFIFFRYDLKEKNGIIAEFLMDIKVKEAMTTLFISDLHLGEHDPKTAELFLRFLSDQKIDALYILGDLFEFWIGDDDPNPFYQQIIQALKNASQQFPIYLIVGNRDFLVGKKFADNTGVQILADPTQINLYGMPTLIMHGDTLCTADAAYQRWRKITRWRWLQQLFTKLPLKLRLNIAQKLRNKSASHVKKLASAIMDVTPEAVRKAFQSHPVKLLIHGHTHRPGVESLLINSEPVKRVTLGDWHDGKGSALVCQRDRVVNLISFS